MLLVDKPAGVTSHDVVARLRRGFGTKGGHAGTLDPFASGVLVVMVGAVTRLADVVGAQVSVKAKRAEGLGALGRGEGVACFAVALLQR